MTALSPEDIEAAQEAVHALARLPDRGSVRMEARSGPDDVQSFTLPAATVRLLTDMLGHIADGRPVAVLPEAATLTTNQAAALLNVSRPHVVKLLETHAMPHTMVGSHRRVLLGDVLAYRSARQAASRVAADALVAQAQELDMGY